MNNKFDIPPTTATGPGIAAHVITNATDIRGQGAEENADGDSQENPGLPDKPENPEGSDVPGTPGTPETPETPGTSGIPEDQGTTPGAGAGAGQPPAMEQVQHRQLSARVPESVSRGAFATGLIVMTGPMEFVLDFMLRMQRPHMVSARIIVPHPILPSFIAALKDNLAKYTARFGPPPELPRPDPNAPRPSIQDVYDDLKIADDQLSGCYANAVMISHSPAEFCLDFITSFFPQSAVSCRLYVAAANIPRMLELMQTTYDGFRRRMEDQRRPPHDGV